MFFLSSIRYCVGECAKVTKTQNFAHPKEPHAQAGIAACSPPSKYVVILRERGGVGCGGVGGEERAVL